MDTHTFFIKCGNFTDEEIKKTFENALDKTCKKLNQNIPCIFYVNIIKNKENDSLGIGFVFISNSAVYHMLCGNNPDGTKRVEQIDDPNWAPKNLSFNRSFDKPFKLADISWADEADEDEKLICPKIQVFLEPLMVLEPINGVNLSIEPGILLDLDQKSIHNVLKCKNVPENVTPDQLKSHFQPFSNDKNFPIVTINEHRVGFIIFDYKTNEARFALNLTRKIVINNNTLVFFHANNRDENYIRDVIRNLNKNHHNKNHNKNNYKRNY